MPPLRPIFKKAYWALVAAGALYVACLLILTNAWVQRHALYAHKLHTGYFQDLSKPEQFGFAKNQISTFNITTPDGETLYAWHVLPIGAYLKNEGSLTQQISGPGSQFTQSESFKLLTSDPDSRLVIYFHGNAGHVAQGWRTDTYRAISSGAADKIHIITVDYRGFGHSTGFPTEQGIITDAIATVDWALNVARIPPERIVLVGHSLGTAITTAVAENFATRDPQVNFAGLVLVSGFSNIPTLMLTYSAGGYFPVLSPLRPYPMLRKWFAGQMADRWDTASRLANFVRKSQHVNLLLLHSENDFDIPWTHSDVLFYAAANATSKGGMTVTQVNNMKAKFDFGEAGWVNKWHTPNKEIRQEVVRHGGHNRVLTYTPVSLAVVRAFGF